MLQTTTTAPGLLLHIPSMDCSVEEAEIRRALEPITGIELLDFQPGARTLNINALMTVAITGAFVTGQWPEASMVMALYAIAELIEAKQLGRTVTLLANERGVLALFAVTDTIRETSRGATSKLKSMGVTTVMLTGDNIPLALGIKARFFVRAVFGDATLSMAVFADMGASFLVMANDLRLLKFRG